MITADKARELCKSLDKRATEIAESIGKVIEKHAKDGKTCIYVYEHLRHIPELYTVQPIMPLPEVVSKTFAILAAHGFKITDVDYRFEVGGGFGSFDEQPREASEHTFLISWK